MKILELITGILKATETKAYVRFNGDTYKIKSIIEGQ